MTRAPSIRPALITGGAGFIGCNVAHRLLANGERVILFDNLSRPGVERNVAWLRALYGDRAELVIGDVRDAAALRAAVERAGQVFHFAAQVAVTTSLVDPVDDFTTNAGGTLNLLEAIRATQHRPPLLFTSTNKVYGALGDLALSREGRRYVPVDARIRTEGIDESQPLTLNSPYGCSKGTADQYVLDYARSFGLQTVVFRMSCIYGPHQYGTEDQGWVAHFLLRALEGEPIVLYGDGCQVRDILFIDDLVNAMLLAQQNIDRLAGQACNVGGGPGNTISLIELLDVITELRGQRPESAFEDWRSGDQRYYVSNTAKLRSATAWTSTIGPRAGIERLYTWILETRSERRPRRGSKPSAVPVPTNTGIDLPFAGGAL